MESLSHLHYDGDTNWKRVPRNSLLTVGVSKYSRSQVFAKRALYKRKPAGTVAAAPAVANKTVEVKGAKNGGSRVIAASKAP
ncbi:hypothetical protein BGX26_007126, partial [Mortierella sp. AD094]